MARTDDLTDEQWAMLVPLILKAAPRSGAQGKSGKYTDRAVLNGILWVLRNGVAWANLPKRFPPASTCFRRFSRWCKTGIMASILEALAQHLEQAGQIDLPACFSDGTFLVAKKSNARWERPDASTIRNAWQLQTLMVFHSPCTRMLLASMQSTLSRFPSMRPTWSDTPDVLSGIVSGKWLQSLRHAHNTSLQR